MEFNKGNTYLQGITVEDGFYRRMIEEIQDYAIIILDRNGCIQNWNKGAEKIKQYSEEEALGKHFSIFYFPEDLAAGLPEKLLLLAEIQGRATHEGWRKRKDGSRFWGSIIITAIHNDEGAVIGFCKVTHDLTDRKLSEDKLKMSEERYHQMIAEVQDYAIILLDVNGNIENWNKGAEKIKGYTTEEIIGKKFEIFYTPEDKEIGLPFQLLNLAREAGKAIHEGWRVRKNGSRFWGTIVITALHNRDGEIIGFSKVTRDLTEKKITEDQLAAYTTELEIQNAELEQFAYVASHDLQEPLRKIRTFSGLIREKIDDHDFVDKYFNKLDASAKRMSELIKSLLNYSRLSKEKPAICRVNLNDVLTDVLEDLELAIAEKEVQIISDTLPVVAGDRTQLSQLFSNLISNSLKFCTKGPVINITYGQATDTEVYELFKVPAYKNYHRFSFSDNGIGFEEKYSKQIFSLFQRLHGKQEYEGTGIGLALCKKIAENHHGAITGSSTFGAGATFNVYLPMT